MRHLTHLLATCYALTATSLLGAAMAATNRVIFGVCVTAAILLGLAIAHHAYHRDELRAARAQLERAARPAPTAHDRTVTTALDAACCERWWTSCGADHDPKHCTRKDQTL